MPNICSSSMNAGLFGVARVGFPRNYCNKAIK